MRIEPIVRFGLVEYAHRESVLELHGYLRDEFGGGAILGEDVIIILDKGRE